MSDIFPRGGGTHVFGVVKNAVTGDPVDAARVTIRTGGSEFTTISDSSGGFQWRDERLFTGEDVKIDVTCSGFEPWQETQVVEDNHLRLEVSLEPVKPESEETEAQRTETRLFRVRDANGDPVAGVEVRLEGPAGALGTAVSDTGGEARITMSVEAAEQTSTYTLRRQGFSDAAGGVEPGQDPVDIVIHPAGGRTSIPGWWLVVAAAVVLGVLLSIVFFLRSPEPLEEPGRQLAEVPDVVNKTLDKAIRSLQQAQLGVGQIEFVEDAGEPNTITWQSSAAGDHVDLDTMVDVRVAGGAPTVAVPSVVGLTQEQAVATLRAAGLVARTSFTSSSTARPDTALEQNPAANVQVAERTTVLLEIAVPAEPEPVPPPLPSPPLPDPAPEPPPDPAPEAPRRLNFQPLTVRPPFRAEPNDPPAAAKDAQGIVHLRGYVTSETSDTNVLASLPAGLQPSASMTIPIWCTTAPNYAFRTSGFVRFAESRGLNNLYVGHAPGSGATRDCNNYVLTGVSYPAADSDLEFQPLTVRPPFRADPNDPPAAAKDAQGIVHLRGYVTSETSDTNVLASLPAGLKPAASMTIPIWCTTAPNYAFRTSGFVRMTEGRGLNNLYVGHAPGSGATRDCNNYVLTGVSYPAADSDLEFQPLTVRPPFQADRNDPPAAAKDAQGIVYLRGYVTSETSDTNVLASLPTGLQPAASMTIPIWCTTAPNYAFRTSGFVRMTEGRGLNNLYVGHAPGSGATKDCNNYVLTGVSYPAAD